MSGTTMLEHPFKSVSFKSFAWHDIASVLCFSSLSFQKAVEKTSLQATACLVVSSMNKVMIQNEDRNISGNVFVLRYGGRHR